MLSPEFVTEFVSVGILFHIFGHVLVGPVPYFMVEHVLLVMESIHS